MMTQKYVCFEIKGDPISIAYGYDEDLNSGVFLSVMDKRLIEQVGCIDDEVNAIAKKFGSGCGTYVDLFTGENGFGTKVSEATMRVYLKRYGIPDEKIDSLPFKNKDKICDICNNEMRKLCDKCKKEYSPCRKSVNINNWYVHDFIPCDCDKNSDERYVYGILLPEKGEKPVLVQMKMNKFFNEQEEKYSDDADLKPFFGNSYTDFRYMIRNPIKKQSLPDILVFRYRDNFMEDVSNPNQLIEKLTKHEYSQDWRGPVLILKAKRTNDELDPIGSYINAGFDDMPNIIDFFQCNGEGASDEDIEE